MIAPHLHFMGLTGIAVLALGTGFSAHAQTGCGCNPIVPELISQSQSAALGEAYPVPSAFPGGSNVTDIVRVFNRTPCRITLRKIDAFGLISRNQTIEIEPGASYQGSMWVPWADHWDSSQRLYVVIANRSYFQIWQKGNRVAFRTEAEVARLRSTGQLAAQYDSAPSVPGFAPSGGRRHLYIAMTSDGRPYFRLVGTNE